MNRQKEANLLKTLLDWCKQMTIGYANVNVVNFTSSWRNGLAFCALMHRFNPSLIDFASLSKDNALENNRLAFEAGETLGIPVLLDPEDMIVMDIPDKIAVVTYLSTVYCHLKDRVPIGGPNVVAKTAPKRPSIVPTRRQSKVVVEKEGSVLETMDICEYCHERVHLIERYWIGPHLYHRACYVKNSTAISRMSISEEGTVLPLAGTMATPGESELRVDAMRRNSNLLGEMTKRGSVVPPQSLVTASLRPIKETNVGNGDEPLRLNFRATPSQVQKTNPPLFQEISPAIRSLPPSNQSKVTPMPSTQQQVHSLVDQGATRVVQVPPAKPVPQVQEVLRQTVPPSTPVFVARPTAPVQPVTTPQNLPLRTPQATTVQRAPLAQPVAPNPVVPIKVAEPPKPASTVPAVIKVVAEPAPKLPPSTSVEVEPDNSVMSGDTSSFTKSDSFKRKTARAMAAQFEQQQKQRLGLTTGQPSNTTPIPVGETVKPVTAPIPVGEVVKPMTTPTPVGQLVQPATAPLSTARPPLSSQQIHQPAITPPRQPSSQPSPVPVVAAKAPPQSVEVPKVVPSTGPLVVTVPLSGSSASISAASSSTPSPAPSDASGSGAEKTRKHRHHHKHREGDGTGERKHKHKHRHSKEKDGSSPSSPLTPATDSPSPTALSVSSSKNSSELMLTPPSSSSTSSIVSPVEPSKSPPVVTQTQKQPQIITKLPPKQTTIPQTTTISPAVITSMNLATDRRPAGFEFAVIQQDAEEACSSASDDDFILETACYF